MIEDWCVVVRKSSSTISLFSQSYRTRFIIDQSIINIKKWHQIHISFIVMIAYLPWLPKKVMYPKIIEIKD
jgi:hypothetical protein